MRPVPRGQFLIVGTIFMAVAAIYSLLAASDFRLNDSQVYMAAASLKYHDGGLFPCDGLFGASGLWRFHTPVVQRFMDVFLTPSGYQDFYLPLRCLVGIATLIYLAGMFALLYRQTSSWQAATFTSVLSSAVLFTVGRSYWGVGSLASMTPWTLAMIFAPPLALWYLHRAGQWRRLLVVFFVIGLLGNVHLVVAMNLALVLALVYLGQNRFARIAWPRAAVFGALAMAGALPSLLYYQVLRLSGPSGRGEVGAATVYEAFRMGDLGVLYPDLFKSVFVWLLSSAVVVILPGLILLSRSHRFHVRDSQAWAWFAGAALFVGFVLHGLSQLLGILFNTFPPTIDLVQAATLVMLPLYVVFAHALAAVFRMFRPHRVLLGVACGAILLVRIVPSDNFRPARYALLDALTLSISEPDKPSAVQRHRENTRRFDELREIGQFAQWRTQEAAVFVTDQSEFRMLGRRSVVACPDDVKYCYYLAPGRLKEWLRLARRQHALLRPRSGPSDPAAMAAFIREIRAWPEFRRATQWYVIYGADEAPDANPVLEPVASETWGRFYRLYRFNLFPTGPATKGTTHAATYPDTLPAGVDRSR